MNQTWTLARREWASFFFSPIAYVVLGIFALGTALIFFTHFAPGQPAELRPTFQWLIWLMIFLVPAISMRLLAEEFRSGTIEPLMTAPVGDVEVILGKWLGAMGFFAVLLLAPLAVLTAVLEAHANPDYGPIVSGVLGLLLVGGLYLAIGTLASALTQNQIIAFLISVLVISLFTIVLFFLAQADFVRPIRPALYHLNVNRQYEDFSKGLIDTSNFVFFVSGTALFLFLAVRALEARRWA